MAMENKRITQLSTERLNLTSGDYVMVDDADNGSAKYRLDRLKETDSTLSVSGKAADAAATGQAISDEATARENADNALDEDISDLKSALVPFNFTNILGFYPLISRTLNGVTVTALGNGQYNVSTGSGAASNIANFDFFSNAAALPDGVVPGGTYYGRLNSTKAHLYVYDYTNSVTSLLFDSLRGDTQFTLPETCTGIIIRLQVYRNVSIDETLMPVISDLSMTDADLEQNIKTLIDQTIKEQGLAASVFSSCDNAPDNSVYFVSATGGITSPEDFPYNFPGFLVTIAYSANIKSQVVVPYYTENNSMLFRVKQNSATWTEWKSTEGRSRTIYVNGDTYNNEYNITTSPTITTDSNGWLAPVDSLSTPEADATDMSGAIMSLLSSTGYCHLAPGIYYVSGNIDLPFGATLEGCGNNTIVRLLSSVESGYIVKTTRYSTIKGIKFSGGAANPDLSSADIGGRHGIMFIANADSGGSLPYVRPCNISDCWFENFTGAGIYCNDSGGGTQQGLIASNCYIEFCKVGIDIWYYSEYHKFTNIVTYHCYYGCINNAGNNVFIGCTFHGTVGFLIDNASDNLRNPGHGSAVGCTFNHIDNWNRPTTKGGGSAVTINGNRIGFVFTGCQFWYGTIDISNSAGVLFSDSQFGGANGTPAITVTGEYPSFFNGCIFHSQPTLNVNSISKFNGCYLHETGAIVSN